ncbi:bile acid:sodium symporter family protein [Massilia putida]|uniref:bile acid:sodium symporter family protein n=1 Tax=Massilia putida TaxID=1141883 RepID=UPI000952629C|nr:bile acid:sodium symporter family protein [Massilia putida]
MDSYTKSVMAILGRHGYMACILAAAALGLLLPGPGGKGGALHLGALTHAGIMLVFFLHGANLSPGSLKAGLTHWRLHLFVQLSTFALCPLIGAAIFFGGRSLLPADMLLGFFYLCALPSTISSSVAMTAMARGNVAGAIFNATASGLIGMALTPVLMSLVMAHTAHPVSLASAITDVMLQLMLPFALGQLLRHPLLAWLARTRSLLTYLDRGVIVLIVHASFCDSQRAGVWSAYPAHSLALLVALSCALLLAVLLLTTWASRRLGFTREDEVAAVFCGSKKSLANGMPMANAMFVGDPAMGIFVLPMIVYHQLQLLVCSVLAQRYAARGATPLRAATGADTVLKETSP